MVKNRKLFVFDPVPKRQVSTVVLGPEFCGFCGLISGSELDIKQSEMDCEIDLVVDMQRHAQ